MKASHFTEGETEAPRDCPQPEVSVASVAAPWLQPDHAAAFSQGPGGGAWAWAWAVGENSLQKHRPLSAEPAEWTLSLFTDTPTLAGMWLSVHSLIQETRPNILGQAWCWELAQRPSDNPTPGPATSWGGHVCHDSLVGNLQ